MKKTLKNRFKSRMIEVMATTLMFTSCFTVHVNATEIQPEKMYQIVLRAGEHGNFDVESSGTYNPKRLVFNVEPKQSLSVKIESGVLSVDLDGNMDSYITVCNVLIDAQYSGQYFVKYYEYNFADISKNQDYVVDYARLVDAVEYKVEYIDNVTGVQIAEPVLAYGNQDEWISFTAKSISNYAFAGSSTQPIKLDKNKAIEDNTITLKYNSTLTGGTTTNTTYQTIDGGTETINETQQNPIYQPVPGAAPAAAVATTGGTGGGAGTTIIGEEETALDATIPDEADTEDETAQGDTEAAEDEQDAEEATIEEEEVALAPNANQPVNVAAVAAVMLGGIAVVLAVIWIIARRRTAGIDDDNDQNDKNV